MNTNPPRIGSLCTGYGGLDIATITATGGTLTWVADNNPAATAVLNRHWPHTPNLGDITTTNWHTTPPIDILTAGFPCQDISSIGQGAGIEGTRSGIWTNVAHAIRVLRPELVILENVPTIAARGLSRILTDLATARYDAQWLCLPAAAVGAPHHRNRWWCIAQPTTTHPTHQRRQRRWPSRRRRTRPAHRRDTAAYLAQWGHYAPAIARWADITNTPPPQPTAPGTRHPRLTPTWVEWLMGLPPGWVTATPHLTRRQQLILLGNGVVPQQATHAITQLLHLSA